MPLMHPSVLKSAGSVSAQSFFEHLCPALLRLRGDRLARPARVAFQLQGEGGGVWMLDFTRGRVNAHLTGLPPQLAVSMEVGDFEAMLRGELKGVSAVASGKMHLAGDRQLLSHLAELFRPLEGV